MTPELLARKKKCDLASWILMGIFLVLILIAKLLPALLAGLLVHELVHRLAHRIPLPKQVLSLRGAKAVSLLLMVLSIVSGLAIAAVSIVSFFRTDAANLGFIFEKMAQAVETIRGYLPHFATEYLPTGTKEIQDEITGWLRSHASSIGSLGTRIGYGLIYAIIGMVIGALISLTRHPQKVERPLFLQSLVDRAKFLTQAFGQIVFAQVQISAINTTITTLYLAVILPLFGVELPLIKTMITITFIAGLLPVLGNLISNTVIVTVSLSYSLPIAILSLAYLVVIHKLEYFINARIIGGQIEARAWEILIAMLIMEAIFGIPGVVAAPIFYAYLKKELGARNLI